MFNLFIVVLKHIPCANKLCCNDRAYYVEDVSSYVFHTFMIHMSYRNTQNRIFSIVVSSIRTGNHIIVRRKDIHAWEKVLDGLLNLMDIVEIMIRKGSDVCEMCLKPFAAFKGNLSR